MSILAAALFLIFSLASFLVRIELSQIPDRRTGPSGDVDAVLMQIRRKTGISTANIREENQSNKEAAM